MRVLMLAAGFGTRLKPLTDILPKPLIPVLNQPLLEIALRQLKASGFTDFAVNAHHLPEQILDFAKRHEAHGTAIQVSVETPEILGSGGVLIPFKNWYSDEPFLVYNGDILSNIDFLSLWKLYESRPCAAVLAVKPGRTPSQNDRAVWLNESGEILAITKDRPAGHKGEGYTFAGAYVTDGGLLQFLPHRGPSDVIAGFNAAIEAGLTVRAAVHEGYWADVGTPLSLWQTSCDISALPRSERQKLLSTNHEKELFRSPSAVLGEGISTSGLVVLADHVHVGDEAVLKDVLTLPGTHIKAGSVHTKEILGPGGICVSVC